MVLDFFKLLEGKGDGRAVKGKRSQMHGDGSGFGLGW